MIIENICLLLEILTIVICLHYLYDEKLKFDIVTTSLISIDMIIMTIINTYKFPQMLSIIMYPIIIIYCVVRFKSNWKDLLINNILYITLISGIQVVLAICLFIVGGKKAIDVSFLLMVNLLTLLVIVIFGRNFLKIRKVSLYLQNKEKVLYFLLGICMLIASIGVLGYKSKSGMIIEQYIILFVGIICVCVLAIQLGKYKLKTKEAETELKMYELYEKSFANLIESIRSRQHEFDNHINTIYSQHYVYKSYNELVRAQTEYCQEVVRENKFNKLLIKGNLVVIGFLYGRFAEIDKMGINLSFEVDIKEMNVGIPIYKIIEILGNLINNAVEALQQSEKMNDLYVAVKEFDKSIEIIVKNESAYIEHDKIEAMFLKGNSSKGTRRGLGLFNVKKICGEYKLSVSCFNETIDDSNWLSFVIKNE